jgi:hypothetical protein
MKRPARPFVVEVKKKRGNLAKRNSIWGDLDLSAIAGDALRDPVSNPEPPSGRHEISPVPAVDRVDVLVAGREVYSVGEERHSDDVGREVGEQSGVGAPADAAEEPARRSRKHVSRRDEPTLPRGQRWKRRLPKVLRR